MHTPRTACRAPLTSLSPHPCPTSHPAARPGDDEENWACGLRAAQWWAWRQRLMSLAARRPDEAANELERLCADAADAAAAAAAEPRGGHAPSGGGGEADGGGDDAGTPLWRTGLLLGSWAGASRLLGATADGAAVGDEAGAGSAAGSVAAAGAIACLDVGSRRPTDADADADADGTAVATAVAAAAESSAEESAVDGASADQTAEGGRAAATMPMRLRLPLDDTIQAKHGVWQHKAFQWQRRVLPAALRFAAHHLAGGRRVLICCDRGDDRAPAVALAALLALFDARGAWRPPPAPRVAPDASRAPDYAAVAPNVAAAAAAAASRRAGAAAASGDSRGAFGKDEVRSRLALLQGIYPAANVQRSVIKELNNFFVSPTGGWQYLDLGLGAATDQEEHDLYHDDLGPALGSLDVAAD